MKAPRERRSCSADSSHRHPERFQGATTESRAAAPSAQGWLSLVRSSLPVEAAAKLQQRGRPSVGAPRLAASRPIRPDSIRVEHPGEPGAAARSLLGSPCDAAHSPTASTDSLHRGLADATGRTDERGGRDPRRTSIHRSSSGGTAAASQGEARNPRCGVDLDGQHPRVPGRAGRRRSLSTGSRQAGTRPRSSYRDALDGVDADPR